MKKYSIQFKMLQQKLAVSVNRMHTIHNIQNAQAYYRELDQTDFTPETLFLFGSLTALQQYLSKHPQNIAFQQEFLQLTIKVPILGQFKYIYLHILPHLQGKSSLLRKKIQELCSQKTAVNIHKDAALSHTNQLSEHYIEEIQWYSSQLRRLGNQEKREQTRREELQRDIIKCTKRDMQLNEQISKYITDSDNLSLEYTEQPKQQTQQQVYLYELSKIPNFKVQQLIKDTRHAYLMLSLELSKVELKSIRYISMFTALKQLTLSNNLISHMKGMQRMVMLQMLDLSVNRIGKVEGLHNNIHLKVLILHTNKLDRIDNLFHLKQLELLSLSNNLIKVVPSSIEENINLVQLRLVNNNISELPIEIQNLKNLKILSILGNPCFCDRSQSRFVINGLVQQKSIQTIGSLF